MSIKSFFKKLFRSPAAQEVVEIMLTETQEAVALLMTLPIAKTVRDNILTISNDSLSGQQKFDVVLGRTIPALIALMKGKGLETAAGDIEDIARGLVQAIYNDVASARAGTVARKILTLFEVR